MNKYSISDTNESIQNEEIEESPINQHSLFQHSQSKNSVETSEQSASVSPVELTNPLETNHIPIGNESSNINHERELRLVNSSLTTYSLLVIASAVVGMLLIYLKDILVPLVIALFLYYLMKPIIHFITKPFHIYWPHGLIYRKKRRTDSISIYDTHSLLPKNNTDNINVNDKNNDNNNNNRYTNEENRVTCDNFWQMELLLIRIPNMVGIFLSIIFVVGICVGVTMFIISAIDTFQKNEYDDYIKEASRLITEIETWCISAFKVDISNVIEYIQKMVPLSTLLSNVVVYIYDFICQSFWVLLYLLYLLFEGTGEEEEGEREGEREGQPNLHNKVNEQIERYIVVKTLISLGVALLVYIVLGPIFNVKLSSVWFVTTFFFNYIPNVGPVFATLITLPVIILDTSLSWFAKTCSIIIPFLLHAIIGNVVEPQAFGSSLELHPIVVLICLAVWYMLWGITGAILSVPITAIIRIFLTEMDYPAAQWIVRLLEGNVWNTNGNTNPTLSNSEVSLNIRHSESTAHNYHIPATILPSFGSN
ncbi:hypothetical protein WA158_007279 [Blastocystis sp. Blastoise]